MQGLPLRGARSGQNHGRAHLFVTGEGVHDPGYRRLATTFGIAIACTGAPLLLIGAFPSTATTLVVFALIGLAIIVGDVAGYTLLQRGTPSDVLARVFGVLHSLFYATVAAGAILAPPLIGALGIRWALVWLNRLMPGFLESRMGSI